MAPAAPSSPAWSRRAARRGARPRGWAPPPPRAPPQVRPRRRGLIPARLGPARPARGSRPAPAPPRALRSAGTGRGLGTGGHRHPPGNGSVCPWGHRVGGAGTCSVPGPPRHGEALALPVPAEAEEREQDRVCLGTPAGGHQPRSCRARRCPAGPPEGHPGVAGPTRSSPRDTVGWDGDEGPVDTGGSPEASCCCGGECPKPFWGASHPPCSQAAGSRLGSPQFWSCIPPAGPTHTPRAGTTAEPTPRHHRGRRQPRTAELCPPSPSPERRQSRVSSGYRLL